MCLASLPLTTGSIRYHVLRCQRSLVASRRWQAQATRMRLNLGRCVLTEQQTDTTQAWGKSLEKSQRCLRFMSVQLRQCLRCLTSQSLVTTAIARVTPMSYETYSFEAVLYRSL